jgi:SEC-C motif domain protein
MSCVCGKGESNEACCLPYIKGDAQPPTAEALMRSRYAAYVLGEIDYIIGSHDPETVEEVDRENAELWSKSSEWQGLEIVKCEDGGAADEKGTVEFIARFKMKGFGQIHHELATFRKHDGRWVFSDAKELAPPPQVNAPRVGRNDPCTCGSGKKFKKCCGKAA